MSKLGSGLYRKAGLATMAIGAAALMTLGGATIALAATGDINAGIRDVVVSPDAPAVNFSTPGTIGTFSFNNGDGTPAGTYTFEVGDVSEITYTLPVGLEFTDFCVDDPAIGLDCTYSSDLRTLVMTRTTLEEVTASVDWNAVEVNYIKVQSTGEPISGLPTAAYTQFPDGLTTEAASAVGIVEGEEPPAGPLVLGGVLAAAGLGAGALVISRRRKVAA